MAEAPKVEIARAAMAALEGVTRSNGYLTDLGRNVSRRRASIYDLNATNFPRAALFFVEGEHDQTGNVGCFTEHAFLMVEVLIRKDDVEDEVLRAEHDVRRAILADRTLGGTAQDVSPADWKTDWLERTDFERGIVRVPFEVERNWNLSNP